MNRFAKIISSIIFTIKSGCSLNIFTPGVIPYIIREPMRMAVTESPGIPIVSIVINAPPKTPLLEMVDTAIPSREPFPYSSPCFESFLPCPQQIIEAISPPAAGIIPIIIDKSPDKKVGSANCFISCLFGRTRPNAIFCFFSSFSRATCSLL